MFDKLFGKKLDEGEYIELDTSEELLGNKIQIKVDKIEDFIDTDKVQKAVRAGAIVLVKIKTIRERDLTELKRAIDKLRKTVVAMNGNIVGIDEDYILLTPPGATILR
ncbi:MAG: cell division protein SepF [Nanoarchaeota archaeon]|nr:cell division protein SepF [Nanoarchaeota archaeon]